MAVDINDNHSQSAPKKVLGVKFAPLNVPWERRLQMLSVITWFVAFIFFPAIFYPVIIYLLILTNWAKTIVIVVIPYLTWILIIDKDTPHKGGRRWDFVRNWKLWKRFNEYFPIRLVKTTDLDPKKNYLFCGHPHGLLCTGVFGCFATEGNIGKEMFPGLEFSILTFDASFRFPLTHDLALFLGLCSASRRSMNHILSHPDGGKVGIIIPGGAQEALDFHPGSYVIQLEKRKGFIKVALQNGSPLVPVFSFGETDIYSQMRNPRGSTLRSVQDTIQKFLAIPPTIFYGRGIFQYTFGFLPNRRPITVVVGAPIPVEKIKQPTQQDIDKLHEKYVDSLTELFYSHSEKYSFNGSKPFLTIL